MSMDRIDILNAAIAAQHRQLQALLSLFVANDEAEQQAPQPQPQSQSQQQPWQLQPLMSPQQHPPHFQPPLPQSLRHFDASTPPATVPQPVPLPDTEPQSREDSRHWPWTVNSSPSLSAMSLASTSSVSHSQMSSPPPPADRRTSAAWLCPFHCGKVYRASSARSIQRHLDNCNNRALFEHLVAARLAAGQSLPDEWLGRRRQRRRRRTEELLPRERWYCPNNCGRYFRSTSTRSIQRHRASCIAGTDPSHDQRDEEEDKDDDEDTDGDDGNDDGSDDGGESDGGEDDADSADGDEKAVDDGDQHSGTTCQPPVVFSFPLSPSLRDRPRLQHSSTSAVSASLAAAFSSLTLAMGSMDATSGDAVATDSDAADKTPRGHHVDEKVADAETH